MDEWAVLSLYSVRLLTESLFVYLQTKQDINNNLQIPDCDMYKLRARPWSARMPSLGACGSSSMSAWIASPGARGSGDDHDDERQFIHGRPGRGTGAPTGRKTSLSPWTCRRC